MNRRSLRRDTEGLSTTEYVILLLVVACVGIAAWKLFGVSAMSRTATASGNVGALAEAGGAGGGRAGAAGGRGVSRLEELTGEAPPPEAQEDFTMPYALLGGAVVLLGLMAAMRMRKGDGGGEGDGDKEA